MQAEPSARPIPCRRRDDQQEDVPMKIDETRILVTGAASGMGRHFALSLCREGARVAAMDLNSEGLEELERTAADLPGVLRTYQGSVSSEADVVSTVQCASRDLEGINGLVNNAGIFRDGLLVKRDKKSGELRKMSLEQWQAVIDVDLTGPFLMTREVAAQMLEKQIRPGVIINISSVARSGNMGQSNYSAAKAGLVADTKLWARELAPHGIRVGAIAPGFIRTPILDAMRPEMLEKMKGMIPLKRLGEPEEIYAGVRFIIECDYFTARCLDLDGGVDL
jgi:3-oxoacyl-[acyl-carrier protein] reductase